MRETSRRPRLLVLVASLALAVALLVGALAVFAAQARAGSYDSEPPKGVLMKYETVLEVRRYSDDAWTFYQDGGWASSIGDNFGDYFFPKADTVGAGTRLHVRFAKSECPSLVEINAYPKVKDGNFGDKSPPDKGSGSNTPSGG